MTNRSSLTVATYLTHCQYRLVLGTMVDMRVLFISYEIAPLFKVGGLGDVAGSLPKALAALGTEISLLTLNYEKLVSPPKVRVGEALTIPFAHRLESVNLYKTTLPHSDIPVYLLDNISYLRNIFVGQAQFDQFAFFSKAVTEVIHQSKHLLGRTFDIVHLNDWHGALIPLLLDLQHSPDSPKTLLTIHNFGYQAVAPRSTFEKLHISSKLEDDLEADLANNKFAFLKQGLLHADFMSTVSPTYREEILDPRESGKLAKILQKRKKKVAGILNGIDTDVWNPTTDHYLSTHFARVQKRTKSNTKNLLPLASGKRIIKRHLQEKIGLPVLEDMPLFAFIGRLDAAQKGIDILIGALEDMLSRTQMQIVILGTGDHVWEDRLSRLVGAHKTKLAFVDRFDELLAHTIYAGADFVVVPSRYEPCGLVQMIAMQYGTIPIVRKTGGLADTVEDGKTGLVFSDYSARELGGTLKKAIQLYTHDESTLAKMIQAGGKKDFSWKKSAKEYLQLYKKILRV